MNKSVIFLLSMLFFSCSNSKSVPDENALSSDSENTLNAIALDRIGPNYITEFNSDSTFALVKNPQKNRPFVSGVFFVFDVMEKEVILEDVLVQGRINWRKPFELEVVRIPGVIRGDEGDQKPKGYLFDAKKRRRIPIGK